MGKPTPADFNLQGSDHPLQVTFAKTKGSKFVQNVHLAFGSKVWYNFGILKIEVVNMKECEIVAKFCNACAGSSRPQTFFEEAELESTDDFVRMKHGAEFDKFSKETLPSGQIVYKYDNGSVMYSYEFTELG